MSSVPQIFAHFLAHQIKQSLLGRLDGSESGQLSCGHENAETVKLQATHEKVDLGLCHDLQITTKKRKAKKTPKPSNSGLEVEKKNSRAKREKVDSNKVCGDGVMDEEEECDPGRLGEYDPCCTLTCELRPSASCSPASHPCCTQDCKTAPPTHRCKTVLSDSNPCVMVTTFCDGVDPTVCSNSKVSSLADFFARFINAPDFSRCGWNGICSAGKCMSTCDAADLHLSNKSSGFQICDCAASETSSEDTEKCSSCCDHHIVSHNSCVIARGRKSDGNPCVFGYCPEVACIRVEAKQNFTDEYNNYKDDLDISAFKPGKDHKNVISKNTLTNIFRWIYWILTGGALLAFLAFSVITVLPICKEEDREPNSKRPPVVETTGAKAT
ncbi:disintegrin and metalloproteinase domain-containing protein 17 [Elysia marginata]|uniref:Disintegrin and metalloproteinase domain-containing protein 17 n=1 Tax=Elysia marginata TaxID=1093978 RepID=A0AAV4JAT8_9GAST|nr:disintegrin and metalloproteinase domain-containing protein 17 [Elysia marginata]